MNFYSPGPWDEDMNDIESNYVQKGVFLVGEVDEKIVAIGAYRKIDEVTAEIKRMRVHPDFQRKGYGQQILTALEAEINQRGYTIIQLDTTNRQTAAIALYKKNGYIEVRRAKVESDEYRFTMIFYQKQLT